MVRLRLTARAQRDVERAYRWYQARRPEAAERFVRELDLAFTALRADPELHPVLYRGIRRRLMRQFPYAIWHRWSAPELEVIEVRHLRRAQRARSL
jgi:plasmid stabilization system protein ParE